MVAPSSQVRTSPARFSLAALLVAVTFLGLACALSRQHGAHGLIVSLDLTLAFLGFASVFKITRMCGMRIPRLTFVEFLVLLGVCAMLHGLAMPAVEFRGQRRSVPAPVKPQALPAAQDDNTNPGRQQGTAAVQVAAWSC